jgi:drug/metabolite transporter (DMT)-like permease
VTAGALVLILIAAVLHATWNYWAKRAGGGLPFVYLVGLIICSLYIPVVIGYCAWQKPHLAPSAVALIFVSGILKTGYSLFLQRGYRTGDFSLIYPLARGTGPLLSTLAAIAFLGERPKPLPLAGGAVIVVSIFILCGGLQWLRTARSREPKSREAGPHPAAKAASYGVVSGVFIAAYTLWDRQGVAFALIPPLLYDAGTAFTQLALLAPFAWKRRGEIAREWREHRMNAFIMSTAAPISYVLVLTAMRTTQISYIAPAREISILIGTFFGAKFLREAAAPRRLWAAAAMVVGLVALALG